LLFGDINSDVPALHWFLDAKTGNPQLDVKHQTCTVDSDCPDTKQICDTTVDLCDNPPINASDAHKAIMIAFFVIMIVVFVVVLFMAYKVHSKHKHIQAEQKQVTYLQHLQ